MQMNNKAIKRSRRQRDAMYQWLIPAIVFLVAVLVIGAIILYNSQASAIKINTPTTVNHPNAKDNGAGNPDAVVKVFAFEDFQCPYCAQYSNQLEPQIMDQYVATGKVYYQFIPYSFIGAESYAAAQAAYCAMDQGKFWEYHDYLYANQNGENKGDFNNQNLQAIAKAMNLDTNTFSTCLSSNKYSQKVNDDKNFAYQSGARGSPYFLVNGTLVGSDTLVKTIDAALAAK
jgi:protein-disulfide isomerase